MKKQYLVGSMFAGIGGICLAFKRAGYKVKWANEIDKNACITYSKNFPEHNLIEGDVHKIEEPNKLGYVDIITAGFPCQAFSVAGYRKGFNDPRGNLFFEIARFIDSIKPRAYLIENVKNLKGHDKGKTLRIIEKILTEDLGYSFYYFILNSKDCNVPQTRERIYIVGFRDKEDASSFKVPEPIQSTRTIHDVLFKERQSEKYYYKENQKYYKTLIREIKSEDTIYQWRRVYVRENKNGLCPTLTANMGTGGHNVPLIKNSHGIRKLIPRECLRFQGFPDDYVIPEKMAVSHLYKQIGNSVTVPVVERIAENIKNVLERNK